MYGGAPGLRLRRRAPDTPDKIKVTNKSEPKDWAEGELEDIEQPDNISVDDFDLLAEQFCELNIVSKESLKKMFVTTERLQQEFFFPTPCRYDAAKRIDRDDGSLQDPDHHHATLNDSHTKPLAIDWDCNKDVARTLKRKQKQKEKQGDEYKYDYKDFPGRYGEWKNDDNDVIMLGDIGRLLDRSSKDCPRYPGYPSYLGAKQETLQHLGNIK